MSLSHREKIMVQVEQALTGLTGVKAFFRSRFVAFAEKETPAVLMEPVRDGAERNVLGSLDWSFTFQVSVIVRGNTGADSSMDPILAEVISKIMAAPGLQALVQDLKPISTDWQFPENSPGKTTAVAVTLFQADYRTPAETIIT